MSLLRKQNAVILNDGVRFDRLAEIVGGLCNECSDKMCVCFADMKSSVEFTCYSDERPTLTFNGYPSDLDDYLNTQLAVVNGCVTKYLNANARNKEEYEKTSGIVEDVQYIIIMSNLKGWTSDQIEVLRQLLILSEPTRHYFIVVTAGERDLHVGVLQNIGFSGKVSK